MSSEWTDAGTVKWRTSPELDMQVLIVVHYDGIDQWVWTIGGWRQFSGYDTIDITDTPHLRYFEGKGMNGVNAWIADEIKRAKAAL